MKYLQVAIYCSEMFCLQFIYNELSIVSAQPFLHNILCCSCICLLLAIFGYIWIKRLWTLSDGTLVVLL